jgi:hypothetical protein
MDETKADAVVRSHAHTTSHFVYPTLATGSDNVATAQLCDAITAHDRQTHSL